MRASRKATVPCVRLPTLPGAALHCMLKPDQGWAVTHEPSGIAIRALIPNERAGHRLMRLLAEAGHAFDRPRDEVVRDDRLTADVLGFAADVCGEHLYSRTPDGSWTLNWT